MSHQLHSQILRKLKYSLYSSYSCNIICYHISSLYLGLNERYLTLIDISYYVLIPSLSLFLLIILSHFLAPPFIYPIHVLLVSFTPKVSPPNPFSPFRHWEFSSNFSFLVDPNNRFEFRSEFVSYSSISSSSSDKFLMILSFSSDILLTLLNWLLAILLALITC